MVMMPIIGNLSDRYGIKVILTLPMCLSILPPGLLSISFLFQSFFILFLNKVTKIGLAKVQRKLNICDMCIYLESNAWKEKSFTPLQRQVFKKKNISRLLPQFISVNFFIIIFFVESQIKSNQNINDSKEVRRNETELKQTIT